jgi:hypothetical protein
MRQIGPSHFWKLNDDEFDDLIGDGEGNLYQTLFVGEDSFNPLEVKFLRTVQKDGPPILMALIIDGKSDNAVLIAKSTLKLIYKKGWRT